MINDNREAALKTDDSNEFGFLEKYQIKEAMKNRFPKKRQFSVIIYQSWVNTVRSGRVFSCRQVFGDLRSPANDSSDNGKAC